VRFGVTDRPQPELERLLGQFSSRFGALPLANLAPPVISHV